MPALANETTQWDVGFVPGPAPALGCTVSAPLVANVAAGPTSLTFASQVVGTASAAQTATVINTGGLPVTVGTVSTSGLNAADFAPAATAPGNTCNAAVVAPGGTCTVGVTLAGAPKSASSRSRLTRGFT